MKREYLWVSDVSQLMNQSIPYKSLPDLRFVAEKVLWIYSDTVPPFDGQGVEVLCKAFDPLRPILWLMRRKGRGSNIKLQDYHRILNDQTDVEIPYIQQVDIRKQNLPDKSYSDVVWAIPELYPEIANLLSLSSSNFHLGFSLIPKSGDNGLRWANLAYGFLWQVTSYFYGDSTSEMKEWILHNYIQSTLKMGGVVFLTLSDLDTRSSLLLLGSSKIINAAVERLQLDCELLTEDQTIRLLQRKQPELEILR